MRARTHAVAGMLVIASLVSAASAFAAGTPVQPGAATLDKFPASVACGCHSARVGEWSRSMHAKAIADPVFRYKVDQAEKEAGAAVATFCRRCHTPIGNMTGDPLGVNLPSAEGVTCMYCHQVVGIAGEPGNTSHLIEPNLFRRAQLKNPSASHPTAYSELHTKGEFCGGCHDVSHPVNGTHLETTYSEWAAGPYAKEGTVCQDCHMSAKPGDVGPMTGTACTGGQERENIFTMSFVGANVGQGPAESSRAMLKRAATLDVSVPAIVSAGSVASVTVSVNNVGAGHYLPTGLTEERQMWLSIYAESADGSRTALGEHRFGTVLKDAEGKFPAEMWEAAAVRSDDRVPPRGSAKSDYAFSMPSDATRATIVAVLSYKSLPDELASKAGVDNPVTEMAVQRRPVFATQAEKDAAEKAAAAETRSGPGGGWLPIALVAALVAVLGVAVGVRARARRP